MVKKVNIPIVPNLSKLETFTLGFEFDKTLYEVKQAVRVRTFKNL